MKVRLTSCHLMIVLSLILFSCNRETKSNDLTTYRQIVKEEADKMGNMLLNKDFKSFVKYTYPVIIEKMGGEEKMIQTMEQSYKDMEASGITFSNVIFEEPSDIITTEDGEIQCILIQSIEMQVQNGRLISKSSLIAISTNQKKNWFFIDTSGKDMQTLRKMLPNLSDQLKVEPQHQPVFYEN